MQYQGGKTRIANEIAQYISAYGGISNEICRREIETLENVLEEIKKYETETTYCIDDDVE